MDKARVYAQRITEIYPDLAIDTVSLNQDGQFNDVIIVNNRLIFRFAKYLDGIKTLQQETIILRNIRAYVTLDIPNPIYQNLDTQIVGDAFVGYEMIPGTPLWYEDFLAIDDDEMLEAMAIQLATFLRELHTIPADEVMPVDLPVFDQRDEWADMYARIQAKLFSYMRPEARHQVARHFETFLDNPGVYQFSPVLRHGDFGTGNIIFDPDTCAITGIIDFGFAGLGDPAIDFAGLLGFGEPFCKRCLNVYPEIAETVERIEFYRGTFALQEALFGIENGDNEAFKSGIADYV